MSWRIRWLARALVTTFAVIGGAFVVWEMVDYRGAGALANAVTFFVLDLFCAGITFLATESEVPRADR